MFSYERWRAWLEERPAELGREGLRIEFRSGPQDVPKPGMTLGIVGLNAMASFESWITGECDYTIMAPVGPKAKMISHKWMQVLTDETFEATFDEFVGEFRKYEN